MNQSEPHADPDHGRSADPASKPAEHVPAAPNAPETTSEPGAAPFGANLAAPETAEPPTRPLSETAEIVDTPERPRTHPLAPDPVAAAAASSSARASDAAGTGARSIADELANAPMFAASAPSSATPPPSAAPVPPASPPPAPAASARPAPEPVAPPRPRVEEVKAVHVTRFDSPAPTIDVQAQKPAPKPPEPVRAAASASSSPPPASNARSSVPPSGASGGASSGAVPPAGVGGAAAAAAAIPAPNHGRFWAAASHLMMIPATLTIFLGGVLTFFIWQLAGREDEFAEDQSREALNFQINVAVVSAILGFSCIGWPLLVVLVPASWVVCIVAAVRSANGERYRYPFIWRVVTH